MNADEGVRASLARLIDGYQGTALVYAAVRLGLPDRLRERARTASALAAELGVPPDRLQRLLRALAALGICEELQDGRFALGASGRELGTTARSGLRERAILAVEQYWPAWAALSQGLGAERTAFEAVFGTTPWEHRRARPELGRSFDAWLAGETGTHCAEVVAALDVAGAAHVADIGGGNGALLRALLAARPHIRGVLFDQPHVVADARRELAEEFGSARLAFAAGDFFAAVPVKAQIYLLKSVIHDWDDDEAARILENCRAAMAPGARLVLIERLLPERATEAPATVMLDIHMLAITGGRERSLAEFHSLLRRAGLAPRGVRDTAGGFSLIEAEPA